MDPEHPGAHLATASGAPVRYRHRVPLVVVDDEDQYWLAEHVVVDDFATADEFYLDEPAVTAC